MDVPRGQEKRRSKRVSIDVKLFYRVQRPPELLLRLGDKEMCVQAADVSEGGVGFMAGCELPISTELVINFNLIFKNSSLLTVKAFGKVQHCDRLKEAHGNNTHLIGIAFTKIDEYDKWMISDFVKATKP